MTRAEFDAAVQSILSNLSDQAAASENLANLADAFGELTAANDTLTTSNAQLTKDNENLRAANLKLFSRLGEQNAGTGAHEDGTDEEDEETPLSFEALFDEKGELK